ncbi:TPA: hypothetical protein ACWS01_005135 [Escherichia coli]|uniref:hypothetical protein n=1 Tax=Escherichia coli TaxID=562 RepID=UPI000BE15DDF|nr:hypothetical protein [Escherichia coli]EEZ6179945.1 hypothetical protein [Escherichia coli O65]EEY8901470.1 hypothetical protein [Escherichia coli]MBB9241362.1 hypothetical protein [Escherichia coli]MCN3074005.1 hypothetical protein [Escherichia coli]TEW21245.1 hypothetical protein E2117_23330 [Escherichia coli]
MFTYHKKKLALIIVLTAFPAHSVTTSIQNIYVGDYNVTVKLFTNSKQDEVWNGSYQYDLPYSAVITIDRPLQEGISAPSECKPRYTTSNHINWNAPARYARLNFTNPSSEWSLYPRNGGDLAGFPGGIKNVIAATFWQVSHGETATMRTFPDYQVATGDFICSGGESATFNFSAARATGHTIRGRGVQSGDFASKQLGAFKIEVMKEPRYYISMKLKGSRLTELNKPEELLTDIKSNNRSAYSLKLTTTTQGMQALTLTDSNSRKIGWGSTISGDRVFVKAEKYGNNVSYPVQLSITYS